MITHVSLILIMDLEKTLIGTTRKLVTYRTISIVFSSDLHLFSSDLHLFCSDFHLFSSDLHLTGLKFNLPFIKCLDIPLLY